MSDIGCVCRDICPMYQTQKAYAKSPFVGFAFPDECDNAAPEEFILGFCPVYDTFSAIVGGNIGATDQLLKVSARMMRNDLQSAIAKTEETNSVLQTYIRRIRHYFKSQKS